MPVSHKTLNKQVNFLDSSLDSPADIAEELGLNSRNLVRLIKTQNRRINDSQQELIASPNDDEVRAELRLRALTRDILIEVLSCYLDQYDDQHASSNNNEPTHHPLISSL
jgi:hypothetical protein